MTERGTVAGMEDRAAKSLDAEASGNSRHCACSLRRSRSNRAWAASFLRTAASLLASAAPSIALAASLFISSFSVSSAWAYCASWTDTSASNIHSTATPPTTIAGKINFEASLPIFLNKAMFNGYDDQYSEIISATFSQYSPTNPTATASEASAIISLSLVMSDSNWDLSTYTPHSNNKVDEIVEESIAENERLILILRALIAVGLLSLASKFFWRPD